jgi:regulatory protein
VPERRPPGAGRPRRSPVVSSPEGAHHAALDLLARRSHFAIELERKLAQKGFAADDVRSALDRLRRSGLVDDARTAVELVTSRLRRSPQGRRRLRAELKRKGLAPDVVDAALAQAAPGDESELARDAARRFQRRRRSADPRALERHLDRLGFSSRDILALSEELRDLQPSDDDS